MALDTVIFIS